MTQNNAYVFNLSPELKSRTEALRKEDQTPLDVMEQVYKLGLYQLEYRREANPKQAAKNKLMRELYKKAQSDPELSVKLGLGTRVEL